MRFSASFLDEIKARLPVSDVVGKRVKLQKAGREWKGLSPFSSEKTPSFFVNNDKQAWFDFSSGQNGNIFDFVMRTEGLTFPEAVERLAGEAGLALPVVSPETEAREKRRASLQDVMELAARYFLDKLQSSAGAAARGYLAGRNIGAGQQETFRIGYAPDERYGLRDFLASKGVEASQMTETGLLIHGEDIPVAYDRFRDRIMFPICDRAGKVIAFGGRAMRKDAPAKYLNSPETPLFHKGSILYNHHLARKAAHDAGTVIAVEGYVDVIAMTSVGFGNVVASCGTALTPDQCELLWRMAEEPVLCFDGDRAGRKAAWRAIDTALPLIGPGRSLQFAFLPEGQDPDDLARSGGRTAVEGVLSAARPLVEVLMQREMEAGPLDTPERRAALEQRLGAALKEIRDETLRRYYREDIWDRLRALRGQAGGAGNGSGNRGGSWAATRGGNRQPGQRFQPRRGAGGNRGGWQNEPAGYRFEPVALSPGIRRTPLFAPAASVPAREAQILLTLMNHPALLADYAEELAVLEFTSAEAGQVRDALLACATLDDPEPARVRGEVEALGAAGPLRRILGMDAVASLWCVKPEAATADAEASLKQALALHRRARALHRELKSAEIALGEDASEENFNRLREIQSELAGLDGREAAIENYGVMSGRPGRSL